MSFNIIKEIKKQYDNCLVLVEESKIDLPSSISSENKKFIEALTKKNKFTGKKGETLKVTFTQGNDIVQCVILGIGKKKSLTREKLKMTLFSLLKTLKGTVLLESNDNSIIDIDLLGELCEHINYSFDKYQTGKDKKDDKKPLDIDYCDPKLSNKTIEGKELGKITNTVRDLVNEPANVMTPELLSKKAVKLGKEYDFEVKVLDEKEIEKLEMGAFLAVGKASSNKPRFIIMKYKGNKSSKNTIGLVGKGLCYDAGGLSIKPTSSMFTMKSDMTGAATVIGTMCAIAQMKIKKNVTAVVAACENVIGGNAYKPGDIITAMSGTTIEVTNTDAEGRMTLADALTYIVKKEKVNEVIDVATLTGAIMVALGERITGVFTNKEENFDKLKKSGEKWGEKYWNMPMDQEFGEIIKSNIADIKNSAGRWGGSSTAAKFLEVFVEDTPWMHLDIAGTSYAEHSNKYYKIGATGDVVKTLYTYIKEYQK